MLHSEYLTQDGVKLLLESIYDMGYRYIYYDTDIDQYLLSGEEPVYEDDEFMVCAGTHIAITNFFLIDILSDLVRDKYIDILDYIDTVDWSKVPMDANVYTESECAGPIREHFARYENGKVYLWANGRTSWSASSEDYVISYDPKKVFLAKETD